MVKADADQATAKALRVNRTFFIDVSLRRKGLARTEEHISCHSSRFAVFRAISADQLCATQGGRGAALPRGVEM